MSRVDELKEKFSTLTDEEKMAFMQSIIPLCCEIFSKHPEKMMPFCANMMKSRSMDMQGIMKMMNEMGKPGA
jgi:hypothetical protein